VEVEVWQASNRLTAEIRRGKKKERRRKKKPQDENIMVCPSHEANQPTNTVIAVED